MTDAELQHAHRTLVAAFARTLQRTSQQTLASKIAGDDIDELAPPQWGALQVLISSPLRISDARGVAAGTLDVPQAVARYVDDAVDITRRKLRRHRIDPARHRFVDGGVLRPTSTIQQAGNAVISVRLQTLLIPEVGDA